MSKPNFKGVDWMELADHWNIPRVTEEGDERTDEEIAQDMVDYVYKHWEKSVHSNDLSHIREIEQDVRDFLQALLSNMREFHPSEVVFWEGLAKLENSYSFLKYASLLFRYMWI